MFDLTDGLVGTNRITANIAWHYFRLTKSKMNTRLFAAWRCHLGVSTSYMFVWKNSKIQKVRNNDFILGDRLPRHCSQIRPHKRQHDSHRSPLATLGIQHIQLNALAISS